MHGGLAVHRSQSSRSDKTGPVRPVMPEPGATCSRQQRRQHCPPVQEAQQHHGPPLVTPEWLIGAHWCRVGTEASDLACVGAHQTVLGGSPVWGAHLAP